MRRSFPITPLFCFLLVFFPARIVARFTIDEVSCKKPVWRNDEDILVLELALAEAFQIIINLQVRGVGWSSDKSWINDLYMFLFGIDSYNPNARVQIIPSFSDIIDVRDDPTKNVKIVCGDAFFVKEGEGRWRNTITGSLVKSPTDVDQLMCDSETLAFASKHAYIGLCPLAWSRIHLIGSRRDRVHGVDSHLDDFLESLPAVLIHEMLHVGSTYGPQGIMRIDDQPAVNSRQQERTGELAYGYARCVNLAIYDPKPTKRCFTNADSLTALAMGVYMHKNDWSLGIAYPLPTP